MQFLKLAAISAALLSTLALSSAQAIQIISPPPGNSIVTKAMNNHGQVVGSYGVLGRGAILRPFMWDGTFHELPCPPNGGEANGINDDGVIVGTTIDDDFGTHAARFTLSNFTMIDDATGGFAGQINNAGNFIYRDAAGIYYYRNIITAAMTRVGAMFPNAIGVAINNFNQVAGYSFDIGVDANIAFVDLGSGSGINLGLLLPGYDNSVPTAIGSDGRVSGIASQSGRGGTSTNFLWDPINGMQTSLVDSYAAFNNVGDAVGGSVMDGHGFGAYWHNGIRTDINNLIGPGPDRCSGGYLVNDLGKMVISINNGEIAYFDPSLVVNLDPTVTIQGGGTFNSDGNPHAATATVTGYGGAILSPSPTITYSPGGANPPVSPGTYQVTASFLGAPHYNPRTATATIVISSTQSVNVNIQGGTFTYDGTAHPASVSITDSNNLAVPVSATVNYVPGGSNPPVTPGSYQVTATFAGNSSYNSSSGTATIVIGNANLVIGANNATKALNAPVPTLAGSISGLVPGDGITASFTTTATQSSAIGTYPITPGVSDPLGKLSYYNVTVTPGTLKVIFGSNSGILQPINADGTSVCKQGSTVPAKFKVYDANGVSIGTPGTVVSFNIVQIVNGTVTTTVNETVTSTTPDSQFRWDGSQWIFNISTKGLSANQTYYFQVVLADGSTVNFHFGLR